MTSDGHRLFMKKDNGLVRSVFQPRHMRDLKVRSTQFLKSFSLFYNLFCYNILGFRWSWAL